MLENVSPAHAQILGDWMGPNAGGSTNTWHWVGTAESRSQTDFDADTLTITGLQSFSHQLTTTPDFVNPASTSVYSPGTVARYDARFTITDPAAYSLSIEMGPISTVRLARIGTGFIFTRSTGFTSSMLVELSGSLVPGDYQFLAAAGLAESNFPNGAHDLMRSGAFDDLRFTVQVPEPGTFAAFGVFAMSLGNARSRRRADASHTLSV